MREGEKERGREGERERGREGGREREREREREIAKIGRVAGLAWIWLLMRDV